MTELTADVFDDLCRTGPVQAELQATDANHAALQRKSRIQGGVALALTAVAAAICWTVAPQYALAVAALGLILSYWAWSRARNKAGAAMKSAILPHMAERAGLTYTAEPDDPEGFAGVRKTLFGGANRFNFSDHFRGQVDGRDMVFYDALIQQETHTGRSNTTHTIFQGQIFCMRRRTPGAGRIVVTPDKGLFNFFKPGKGMERVKFESDRDFEKRFEVYAENPAQAEAILGSSELRARLLELRGKGALFLQWSEHDVLIAVPGDNRFEPGNMAKKISGQDRARGMFNDLCASLTLAKDLSRRLD